MRTFFSKIIIMKAVAFVGVLVCVFLFICAFFNILAPNGNDVKRASVYRDRVESIIRSYRFNQSGENVVMMSVVKNRARVVIKNPTPDKEAIEEILRKESWQDDLQIEFEDANMNMMSKIKINKK